MARQRGSTLLVAVLLAAVVGFAAGWFVRAREAPTPEERAHQAAEHLKKSLEALTK
jgi:hypothetical protein